MEVFFFFYRTFQKTVSHFFFFFFSEKDKALEHKILDEQHQSRSNSKQQEQDLG